MNAATPAIVACSERAGDVVADRVGDVREARGSTRSRAVRRLRAHERLGPAPTAGDHEDRRGSGS